MHTYPVLPDDQEQNRTFHSGVVAVIGPPNAGKSTLLNHFLGQKIAIVTPRPQTTRNRISGILTGESYQMIILDTPGLHKARELINQEMVKVAMDCLSEADVALFLADASAWQPGKRSKRQAEEFREYLQQVPCPVVLALNKRDLLEPDKLLPVIQWFQELHDFHTILPISALEGEGTDLLLETLVSFLPEGPMFYPDDIPTDATERFIVAEMIREKIFLLTREEIPYSTAVMIDRFEEPEGHGPVVIHATIILERKSQKGIIIGRQGTMLAKIRKAATREIAQLLDCRVQLRLWVKIRKNWTENEHILRELGLK